MKSKIRFFLVIFIISIIFIFIVKYLNNHYYNKGFELDYPYPESFPFTYDSYSIKRGDIDLTYEEKIQINTFKTCKYTVSSITNIDFYKIYALNESLADGINTNCYGPIISVTDLENGTYQIVQDDYSLFFVELLIPIKYEIYINENTEIISYFDFYEFASKIEYIDVKYTVINDNNYLPVGVVIYNKDNILKKNAIINLHIKLSTRKDVIKIPRDFLYKNNLNQYYVYGENDIFYVTKGIESKGYVEIKEGLKENERIYKKE